MSFDEILDLTADVFLFYNIFQGKTPNVGIATYLPGHSVVVALSYGRNIVKRTFWATAAARLVARSATRGFWRATFSGAQHFSAQAKKRVARLFFAGGTFFFKHFVSKSP